MLDTFICSRSFFRRVKDCKVVNIGMRSDHAAVQTTFKITAIKFKVIEKVVTQINWELIGYNETANELFDNILSKSVYGSTIYSDFNKAILQAGAATATTNKQKNKGWFHFSRDFLLPLIKTRDALLSDYWILGIGK